MTSQLVRYEWEGKSTILSTWDDRDIVVERKDHLVGYIGTDGVFVLVEILKPMPAPVKELN